MSDETILNEPSRLSSEVIYQRDSQPSENAPEFKPGNTPHTQLGNEIRWTPKSIPQSDLYKRYSPVNKSSDLNNHYRFS